MAVKKDENKELTYNELQHDYEILQLEFENLKLKNKGLETSLKLRFKEQVDFLEAVGRQRNFLNQFYDNLFSGNKKFKSIEIEPRPIKKPTKPVESKSNVNSDNKVEFKPVQKPVEKSNQNVTDKFDPYHSKSND